MAFYALATLLCTVAQSELYMHLYINQVWAGPNLNQGTVINTGGIGSTATSDWTITEGPATGAIVGRAQGIHSLTSLTSASWYSSMNLVFNDSRFAGSTLQVMGTVPQDGQWSISGGTGELTMARGIVNHKVIQETSVSRIYEIDIHAYYIPMNSMVATLGSSELDEYEDGSKLYFYLMDVRDACKT